LSGLRDSEVLLPKLNDVAGMILAGGQSRRMGANKALLLIDGQRLIDRVAEALRSIFPEVIIIGNDAEACSTFSLPCVPDIRPGTGSLGGIYTGLSLSRFSRAFFAACDMPFLSTSLIHYMASLDPAADVVVPRTREGLEPLHAVYSRRCVPFIRALLDKNCFKVIDFFHQVRVREVEEEEMRQHGWRLSTFFNINTQEELARAIRLARAEGMEP
jgi:molybdopterin-guanine dinucleotide biosynthesis protein A